MKPGIISRAVLAFGFVLVIAMAGPAAAAQGFYLGTGGGLATPTGWDDPEAHSGISLEYVHLGYNFTDHWGISFNLGGAAGTTDDMTESSPVGDMDFEDLVWAQAYSTISGRYTFDQTAQSIVPYLEFGLGSYALVITGDVDATGLGIDGDADAEFDEVTGYRLALGGQYYFNNLYLAPELSYHIVNYDDGELEMDFGGFGSFEEDIDGDNADMLALLLKVGYHFK
jgi:hypothetical protein